MANEGTRLHAREGGAASDRKLQDVVARRLFDRRIVNYSKVVTRETAQDLVAQLLCLDAESSSEPIRLFINSPGGDADSGFAVYDVLKFVKAPVHIICAGLAASAAVIILLGTTKERRLSLRHARIMIHQPSSGAHGDATDLQIEAAEIIKCREAINVIIADETGQDVERVRADVQRNFWMSADEALEYGLVSKIADSYEDLGL